MNSDVLAFDYFMVIPPVTGMLQTTSFKKEFDVQLCEVPLSICSAFRVYLEKESWFHALLQPQAMAEPVGGGSLLGLLCLAWTPLTGNLCSGVSTGLAQGFPCPISLLSHFLSGIRSVSQSEDLPCPMLPLIFTSPLSFTDFTSR